MEGIRSPGIEKARHSSFHKIGFSVVCLILPILSFFTGCVIHTTPENKEEKEEFHVENSSAFLKEMEDSTQEEQTKDQPDGNNSFTDLLSVEKGETCFCTQLSPLQEEGVIWAASEFLACALPREWNGKILEHDLWESLHYGKYSEEDILAISIDKPCLELPYWETPMPEFSALSVEEQEQIRMYYDECARERRQKQMLFDMLTVQRDAYVKIEDEIPALIDKYSEEEISEYFLEGELLEEHVKAALKQCNEMNALKEYKEKLHFVLDKEYHDFQKYLEKEGICSEYRTETGTFVFYVTPKQFINLVPNENYTFFLALKEWDVRASY